MGEDEHDHHGDGGHESDHGLAPTLSRREKECLIYLAQGLRQQEMADAMGVTVKTVEKQIGSAKRKVRAKTKEQAVAIAIARKLL